MAFVSNHHLAASRQLVTRLGVPADSVIPWDWPLDLIDEADRANCHHRGPGPTRVVYVGSVSRTKGVPDLLRAVSMLRRSGLAVQVELIGAGDETVRRLVQRLDLGGAVKLHGRLGGDDVLSIMTSADFVCVPSRPSYPEGLPLTIYEAMASGTPLLASDHPMFGEILEDNENALIFPAGRPRALARRLRSTWTDPDLYARVANRAARDYGRLAGLPLWGDLITHWILDEDGGTTWRRYRTLNAPMTEAWTRQWSGRQ